MPHGNELRTVSLESFVECPLHYSPRKLLSCSTYLKGERNYYILRHFVAALSLYVRVDLFTLRKQYLGFGLERNPVRKYSVSSWSRPGFENTRNKQWRFLTHYALDFWSAFYFNSGDFCVLFLYLVKHPRRMFEESTEKITSRRNSIFDWYSNLGIFKFSPRVCVCSRTSRDVFGVREYYVYLLCACDSCQQREYWFLSYWHCAVDIVAAGAEDVFDTLLENLRPRKLATSVNNARLPGHKCQL